MPPSPPRWALWALGGSVLSFTLGLVGCAARGWHAPGAPAIAAIYVLGVVFGALAARSRARAGGGTSDSLLRARSGSGVTLAIAIVVGALTAALGAFGVATAIDDWHSLFLASVVGAAWMGTYPLHALAVQALLERDVTTGIDGIAIGRRIVRFAALRSARHDGHSLVLGWKDGRETRITLVSDALAAGIAARIGERLAEKPAAARVGRDGRTLDTWKRELRSNDYRSHHVSTEDATAILRSGAAEPDERIGAAIVLAHAGERDRVRVAASDCVDPAVRRALEQVAEDELDEETANAVARAKSR